MAKSDPTFPTWRELALLTANETDGAKVVLLAQELLKALDRDEAEKRKSRAKLAA